VACGEYGDHTRTLVNAINNGKEDIQDGKPLPVLQITDGLNNSDKFAHDIKNTLAAAGSKSWKVTSEPVYQPTTTELPAKVINDIAKGDNAKDDSDKPGVNSALLGGDEVEDLTPTKRYGNSELQQFFIILSRTLLFSRRDWVREKISIVVVT